LVKAKEFLASQGLDARTLLGQYKLRVWNHLGEDGDGFLQVDKEKQLHTSKELKGQLPCSIFVAKLPLQQENSQKLPSRAPVFLHLFRAVSTHVGSYE
jgi:hypothetical protein